jgi:uncharacterized membrane protein (DUF485 family)
MTALDTLLSAPPEPVDDAGFSSRVMRQVAQQQSVTRQRHEIIEWSALLVAAFIFLLAVPLTALSGALEYVVVSVGTSVPIAMAVMAIVLTTTYLRSAERI